MSDPHTPSATPNRPSPRREAAWQVVDRGLLALVAAAPLALGGTEPRVSVALCVAALGLFALQVALTWTARERLRWPSLAIALGGLALWTLVRATPFGAVFAGPFPSEAWALWPDLGARGTLAPGHAPLAALRLTALAAVVQLAGARFRGSAKVAAIVRAVIIGGALTAAIGIAQALMGATAPLFFVSPVQIGAMPEPLSGPFVNSNQAGSMLALTGVLCAAAVLRGSDASTRLPALFGAAFAGLLVVQLNAWGAVLAFGAGIAGVVVAGAVGLTRNRTAMRAAMLALALAVIATIVIVYTALPGLLSAYAPAVTTAKAEIWVQSVSAIQLSPLTGIGPGSFGDVAPTVLEGPMRVRYSFIESEPLQLVVDHGLVATVLVVAGVLVPLAPRLHARQRWHREEWRLLVAVIGASIAVEATTGMGLHALGYAIPVAALAGGALGTLRRYPTRSSTTEPRERSAIPGRALAVALLATAALTAPGVPAAVGFELRPPATRMDEAPRELLAEAIDEVRHARPAAPEVITRAALLAVVEGDLDAASARADWLREHAPGYHGTWLVAWGVARAIGDDDARCEAMGELLAIRRDVLPFEALPDDPTTWLACIPDQGDTLEWLYVELAARERWFDAFLLASRALRLTATDAVSLRWAARAATEIELHDAAAAYAADLIEAWPDDEDSWLTGSVQRRAVDDLEGALHIVERGIARLPHRMRLKLERVSLRLALHARGVDQPGWEQEVRADLNETRTAALVEPVARRRHGVLSARFFLVVGEDARAMGTLDQLLRRHPNDLEIMRLRARAADRQDARSARLWWTRVLEASPEDPEALRRLDELSTGRPGDDDRD